MSVQALGWVFDHSPATGTDRLVLLAIANHADKTPGSGAWESYPGIAKISREAGLARERTTQEALARLKSAGLIECIINGAPDMRIRVDRRPNLYRIMLSMGAPCDDTDCPYCHDGVTRYRTPSIVDNEPRGDAPASNGVTRGRAAGCAQASPEPSVEPSGKPKCADVPSAHVDNSEAAHRVATWFCNAVIAKTNGIKPKFLAIRSVVLGAMNQGGTEPEVRAALATMWRERRTTDPTTHMIIELVVRDRLDAPDMPPQAAPARDVRRCYRDDCTAPVIVGGECIEGHEQPAPELPVKIEEHHT